MMFRTKYWKLRQAQLEELTEDYYSALEECRLAWREAARMGRVIALYDARVKTRVDADARVREAEATAGVLVNRQAAVDVFWTSLLNGEYDGGLIPIPTQPPGDYEAPDEDLDTEEEE